METDWRVKLSISFGSIVSFAEHFTIFYIRCSTFAPCRDMISIHLREFPDFTLICIVSHGTVWTVRDSFFLCLCRLLCIDTFLDSFIEYTNFEKFRICRTTENKLKNSFAVFHITISIELLKFF